jgi:outer membrane protein OmpA-like peptidoglycan-associated protein
MTSGFAANCMGAGGAVALACLLATSAGAQEARADAPRTVALFFDVESAALSPDAKTIVVSAADAAERAHVKQIALAAYAAPDESAHHPELAARRAAAVKEEIVRHGFEGAVIVDEEAPELRILGVGDEVIQRSVILHLGY